MNNQLADTDIEEIEEIEEVEQEEVEEESEDSETTDSTDTADEDEEITVSIGEETPPQEDEETTKAPAWVKELRKNYRELQRENRELKQKTSIAEQPVQKIEVGKKPSLEDFDYDADLFEKSLDSWYDRKRQSEEQEAQAKIVIESQQKEWQKTLDSYETAKASLKVRDYEIAEDVVSDALSPTQQAMILQGADNPALVVYALGINQAKVKELSTITDPVKFAFAVAKLEATLKVTGRKTPPQPEKSITGTAKMTGSSDSKLNQLKEKADKSGDYTAYLAYKRSIKK